MEKDKNDSAARPAMRLDKWLKISRLAKTRAQAAKACEERKVKVNDQIAKPSKLIHPGDVVTMRRRSVYRTFDVLGISHKSIPAAQAREMYREHEVEMSEEAKELMELYKDVNKKNKQKFKGRPTKKERRDLGKIRGW